MATSPLLASDVPAVPAPAPRAAAPRRMRRPSSSFLGIVAFSTLLFSVSVWNYWGCHAQVAYFIASYVLWMALVVSHQGTVQFPRGSAAATNSWRIFWLSLAGVTAAGLCQPYLFYY